MCIESSGNETAGKPHTHLIHSGQVSVSDNNNFIMLQQNIRLSSATMVVTGGAGFIGSNLCEHLLETGHTVRCLDNFATGHIENILPLFEKHPGRFSLLVGDIRNMEDCRKAVDGMEYVLHEAALGSVPRSIKDPITTNAVNIGGFLNMLVAARDAGVRRFVFAASSSTYGDSRTLPKVEDVIGRPLSPYAITKYVDELYAAAISTWWPCPLLWMRTTIPT